MKQAPLEPGDQPGIGHSVVKGDSSDSSASSACAIIFRLVTDYQESFGGHFDSLPFLTSGGCFIQGASLRSAKSGCEIWSRLQWDICQCRRQRQDWYDQRFTLTDAAGKVLADTYYTIRKPGGKPIHGTTDSEGRTAKHVTDGAQSIRIYLGHKQDA
ncbi:hypothetical protein [Paraburkholderia susongensis]|uniref:Uncharacterized protein n=1 Tax=Paraburkholderia susongensis TaxID=1515439 RepID=A0A1X7J089_9BURK|nr:hypothetical protein [Paraburkholderia susongensis]SMG21007.1 hypothetical protein SAMN06265784_10242 [Paraburkholderia susongensis]